MPSHHARREGRGQQAVRCPRERCPHVEGGGDSGQAASVGWEETRLRPGVHVQASCSCRDVTINKMEVRQGKLQQLGMGRDQHAVFGLRKRGGGSWSSNSHKLRTSGGDTAQREGRG